MSYSTPSMTFFLLTRSAIYVPYLLYIQIPCSVPGSCVLLSLSSAPFFLLPLKSPPDNIHPFTQDPCCLRSSCITTPTFSNFTSSIFLLLTNYTSILIKMNTSLVESRFLSHPEDVGVVAVGFSGGQVR